MTRHIDTGKIEMDKCRTIEIIQDLLDEILEIQREDSKDGTMIGRVQEIVQQSSRLVENSKSTNEILLDAKILHIGSQILSSNISSLDAQLGSFNEEEYTKGILKYVEDNFKVITSPNSWENLAPFTYHLYHKSTPVTFMLGSLSLDAVPVKEKVKVEKCKRVFKEKTKLVVSSENPDKDKKDIQETICGHILRTLQKCYKENGKKPVLFINFIINKDSYWHSVENIFYFSFLVRDGLINMYLNDKNLPVIEPAPKSSEDPETEKKQFCFSLSIKDWKNCIEKFQIMSTQLKPYQIS